jgi:hypothetical protein
MRLLLKAERGSTMVERTPEAAMLDKGPCHDRAGNFTG